MAKRPGSNEDEFLRLKPSFLDRTAFDWKGIKREGFRIWARTKREPKLNIPVHRWHPLHTGMPVPKAVIEAFSEYISDERHLGKYPVSVIAEPCPPEEDQAQDGRPRNAWRLRWSDMLADVAGHLTLPDEAYCENEADLAQAARMVMHWLGCMAGHSASAAAITFAERVMRRTPEEYAQLLLTFWKANENSVLFATTREKSGQTSRVGVTVVAPLTEAFYRRFRSGDAEDMDITPKDTTARSLFQLVGASAENPAIDVRRDKARRSMTQARIMLFQYASLAPPLFNGNPTPRIITVSANEEMSKRLRSYSYREVGTTTRISGMPIVEFAPPDKKILGNDYPGVLAQYVSMKSALLVYQAMIEAQDRLIGH